MGVTLRKYVSCLCLSVLFYIRVWADFVDLARERDTFLYTITTVSHVVYLRQTLIALRWATGRSNPISCIHTCFSSFSFGRRFRFRFAGVMSMLLLSLGCSCLLLLFMYTFTTPETWIRTLPPCSCMFMLPPILDVRASEHVDDFSVMNSGQVTTVTVLFVPL